MFSLRLLGGASLEGDDGFVRGRAAQPRRIALLALLALEPRNVLSRDKLIAYLWPESDDQQGRHLLSESLYVLRATLGEGALDSLGDSIRLDSTRVSCDATLLLEAIRSGDPEGVLSLYSGPFLDGFFLKGAPEFEHWVDSQRARLTAEFAEALEVLAKEALREGRFIEAVRWSRQLTDLDPFNSRSALQLMEALVGAGESGNAIDHGKKHARILREEFGAEPTAEILALLENLQGKTDPGRGRSEIPRSPHGAGSAPPPPVAPDPSVPTGDVATHSPTTAAPGSPALKRRMGPLRITMGLATVVVLGLVVSTLPRPGRDLIPDPVSTVGDNRPGIAVLPFEDRSPDPEDTFFADGIRDEVLSKLSGISGLRVISLASAGQSRDSRLASSQGGPGVDYFLQGSACIAGGLVRLTVQLISGETGEYLWAEEYDREFSVENLIEIQSGMAHEVATRLQVVISPEEETQLTALPTQNTRAYDLYLSARPGSREGEGGMGQVDLLRQAVAEDPEFGVAWAELARRLIFRLTNRWAFHLIEEAADALAKAETFAPQAAETLLARGTWQLYMDYDLAKARVTFRRVLDLRPSDQRIHHAIALLERRAGNWDAALTAHREALHADPVSPSLLQMTSDSYERVRDYGSALLLEEERARLAPVNRVYEHILELHAKRTGNLASLRSWMDSITGTTNEEHLDLARAQLDYYERDFDRVRGLTASRYSTPRREGKVCWLLGDRGCLRVRGDTLLAQHQRRLASFGAQAIPPMVPWVRGLSQGWIAWAFALQGDREAALEWAARELETSAHDSFANPPDLQADIYIVLGDHDAALEMLDRTLSVPSVLSVNLLRIDPFYDSIRSHPGFQALLEKHREGVER